MPENEDNLLYSWSWVYIFEDLQYFENNGLWKDDKVPAWAKSLCAHYNVPDGDVLVRCAAWKYIALKMDKHISVLENELNMCCNS